MVLHTINKVDLVLLEQCLRYTSAGDVLVLMDEAVYLAKEEYAAMFKHSELTLYLLGDDIVLRGFSGRLSNGLFHQIDYDGFIDLTSQNDKLINWM